MPACGYRRMLYSARSLAARMESAVARRQAGARYSRLMEVDRTRIEGRPVCCAGHLGWRESSRQLRRRRHAGTPTEGPAGTSRCDFRRVWWNAPALATTDSETRPVHLPSRRFARHWATIFRAVGFAGGFYRRTSFAIGCPTSPAQISWCKSSTTASTTTPPLQTFSFIRKILLNSTVHNDNTRFTFTDERFAAIHSVLAPYHVANAVNASSCFPAHSRT